MPPKRKTRGKKRRTIRKRLSSAARGAKRRVSAAARYARRNPGRTAGGLAGLGALGLGGYEAYLAAKRHGLKKGRSFTGNQGLKEAIEFEKFKRSNPYESPTGRFVRGVKNYPYKDIPSNVYKRAGAAYTEAYNDAKATGRAAKGIFFDFPVRAGSGFLDRLFPGRVQRRKQKKVDAIRTAYDAADGTMPGDNYGSPFMYGKRKRRRRRKKKFGGHCYGKKASKKPSAATRRMCKKLKVRLTTKRGGKRVYKSEAMLKKQCKKAMKRKSKK